MPVLPNAPQEQLDTATRLDPRFVFLAFPDQVFSVAVEDVYLGGGDVDFWVCMEGCASL